MLAHGSLLGQGLSHALHLFTYRIEGFSYY